MRFEFIITAHDIHGFQKNILHDFFIDTIDSNVMPFLQARVIFFLK